MNNQVLLIRDVKVAQQVAKNLEKQGIPFATVEAEYGEISIEGSHATLSHHTLEYRNYPAPCVRLDVKPLKNGVILISHLDLDTLGGISLLEDRYFAHSFWESEAIIDTQGYLGHHQIPVRDQELMKVYWAWECETLAPLLVDEVVDVTETTHNRLDFLEQLLQNQVSSETIQQYLHQFEEYLASFSRDCFWDGPSLRVFISAMPQHYLSHQREDGSVPTCVTLNPKRGTITISDISGALDCKAFMQELFGEKAGGQFRVAGTPRDEEFGFFALCYVLMALFVRLEKSTS